MLHWLTHDDKTVRMINYQSFLYRFILLISDYKYENSIQEQQSSNTIKLLKYITQNKDLYLFEDTKSIIEQSEIELTH